MSSAMIPAVEAPRQQRSPLHRPCVAEDRRNNNCRTLEGDSPPVIQSPILSAVAVVLLLFGGAQTDAATYYVSPQGNDNASGRRDDPLATIERTRDKVRESGGAGEIVLRGGTYRLARPITFTTHDNGLKLRAEEGETPVLTGGRTIADWKPFRDKILMAKMPDWKPDGDRPCQLFYRGKRQTIARYPNLDPSDPLYGGWAFVGKVRSNVEFESAADLFEKTWSKPAQGAIFTIPWRCWASDIIPIAAVDRGAKTIRTTRQACDPDPRLAAGKHYATISTPLLSGNRFFVQNLIEELDQPGEWCFDADDGAIYFWPPSPTGALGDGDVTIPVTDRLIELRGARQEPIRNITIRGLTFTQTRSMFPPRHLDFNAPNSRGFTLYLDNSADCVVEGNTFDQVGGDAVRLEHESARNAIRSNAISDAGASGIIFNNTDFGGFEFPQYWNVDILRPLAADRPWARGNEVTDNVIARCGTIDKMSAGIKIHGLNCVDNVIAHNLVHHVPLSAIWITMSFGRNIVEFNRLHHTCLEMSDVGAFVSNRVFPFPEVPELAGGTIVRYNLIHDVVGCAAYDGTDQVGGGSKAGGRIRSPYYTFAIYFDNSGTDTLTFGNIVADATLASVAFPVAGPKRNVVENNILLPGRVCKPLVLTAEGSGNRFVRNIIVYVDPSTKPDHGWPAGAVKECDGNVYWHKGAGPYADGLKSLEMWRKEGNETHSVVADPCFVDFRGGGYRLRPESPALKLGFEPIPLERIGPRRAGNTPAPK
jgi:hypothetical protein